MLEILVLLSDKEHLLLMS